MESGWAMFNRQPKNPPVDTGGERGCQAEERLFSLGGHRCLLKQQNGTWEQGLQLQQS